LYRFKISQLNIFEERVFDDTSYTICSFQFQSYKEQNTNPDEIPIMIFPVCLSAQNEQTHLKIKLNENNNYIIGGEIYNLTKNIIEPKYKITRLTIKNKDEEKNNITNILVKCIDDNKNNQINMKIVSIDEIFIDKTEKLSARSYCSLIITPLLILEKQKILVEKFNNYLNEYRTKYHSLFLTNYRDSSNIARKRISFNLIYDICLFLLQEKK
jgi:hypothetical protein